MPVILMSSLLSSNAIAYETLWNIQSNVLDVDAFGDIGVVYPEMSITGSITINGRSNATGKLLAHECAPTSNTSSTGAQTSIISLPEYIGPFRLESIQNWNESQSKTTVGGIVYRTFYNTASAGYAAETRCRSAGEVRSDIGVQSRQSQYTARLDNQDLSPGHYSYTYDAIYSQYNNRTVVEDPPESWLQLSASQGQRVTNTLEFTVESDCAITPLDIELDFGDLTPLQAAQHPKTDRSTISVSCQSNLDFDISVTGMNRVSGETENFTDCEKGSCEVVYALDGTDGRYKDTLQDRNGFNLYLYSIFHPNDNLTAGSFAGSAVIRIDIY